MMRQTIALLTRLTDHLFDLRRTPASVRILIVDDEEPVRRYVERVLHQGGYQTMAAASALEAIQLAQIFPFDLLVTDLMMPDMNGDALAHRLQQDDPNLEVLYLTGYSDQFFAYRRFLWENETFLSKPCPPKALLEAVSLVLEN